MSLLRYSPIRNTFTMLFKMNLVVHQPFFAAFFFLHFSSQVNVWSLATGSITSIPIEEATREYYCLLCSKGNSFPSMNHSKFTVISSKQCVYLLLYPLSPEKKFHMESDCATIESLRGVFGVASRRELALNYNSRASLEEERNRLNKLLFSLAPDRAAECA